MTNIQHKMNFDNYASLDFFHGLSAADLTTLAPFFASKTYVAGTVIFEQGDRAETLFVVACGEVTIRYKPEDGPTMTVTRVQPGSVFGWSAAMGNERYTSGAVCTLDSEILFIRGDTLRHLCEENPMIGNVLLGHLSQVVADRQRRQRSQAATIQADRI